MTARDFRDMVEAILVRVGFALLTVVVGIGITIYVIVILLAMQLMLECIDRSRGQESAVHGRP